MARMATCPYCKTARKSSLDLPFFESRGEGTAYAGMCRECGLLEVAHVYEAKRVYPKPLPDTLGHVYAPRGAWDTDTFYCGCRGWD